MADPFQGHELGVGNLAGQRLAMAKRKQRIGRAVNHQGRGGDLVQPPAREFTLLGQRVVRHAGGHVVGAVHDPRHDAA